MVELPLTESAGDSRITEIRHLGRAVIYAIVRASGKQYRVAPGQKVRVDRMPAEQGSTVELAPVLMIADGEKVTIGKPAVEGAKVIAEVIGHEKDDKVIVYKYKAKVRYRRKKGHRQPYTELAIKQIVAS